MSFTVQNNSYTISSSDKCQVVADSNQLSSHIWFTTPALDKDFLQRINQIQLHTTAHDQGFVSFPEAGSWSWFDILVLDSPSATKPKVKDGLSLLWLSHTNVLSVAHDTSQHGPVFDRSHDIFKFLEAGNAIAVRVCARFPGWENNATSAHLDLRATEKAHALPSQDSDTTFYLKVVNETKAKLANVFDTYLDAATPKTAPPAYSLVREMLLPGPLRADQSSAAAESPLQLLSLDGGGVRGISTLYVLQAIMKKLTGDPNTKPCHYFHMISGTSTGGLIAIMLGRLQMTIPQCIDAYKNLAAKIFAGSVLEKARNLASTGARYSGSNYETALKDFIKQQTGDGNAPMLDPDSTNQCKVFVVAGEAKDLSHQTAEHFRTYTSRFPDKFTNATIWQAARATSAAPTYFPSIQIGDTEFIDGGLRFNNPAILLLGEVNAVYGIARPKSCFLTIGTGMQPDIRINEQPDILLEVPGYLKSVADAVTAIATDCETTNNLARSLFPPGVYWRFNAGVKTGDDWVPLIDMDDYEDMQQMVSLTVNYLTGETANIDQCALALVSLR